MRFILLFLFLFFAPIARSQVFNDYRHEIFQSPAGELPYRILYPINFDSTKSYPLVVFLHGAFEKGTDNERQLAIGGRYFLREDNRQAFPAIVIFPQCPESDSWAYFDNELDSATGRAKYWNFPFRKQPTLPTLILKQLLDSMCNLHFTDRSRMYIGGLSQGAMGVYDIVARYPGIFAAAFSVCGAGKTSTAKNFAGTTAIWIFHGDKDDVVPVTFSRDYYKRLQKLGADVRYTEYPSVYHNSWVNAFGEKELLSWLFSKAKK
jgi:predicted peptidase